MIDIKNGSIKKNENCLKKKTPAAQTFRYFRYKNRFNKILTTSNEKLPGEQNSLFERVVVLTFEENGIFMLGVVFVQSIFARGNYSFQRKFLTALLKYRLSEFNFKKIIYLRLVFVKIHLLDLFIYWACRKRHFLCMLTF